MCQAYMSNRIKNKISALLKYYQASPFSSKMLISNSGDCKDLISLICNGKRGKEVTLSDVNKTKQLLVSAEKIHHQSCPIKTAEDVWNMIYGYDIFTPTRCHHMLNILNVVGDWTDTNFYHILNNKITLSASEHHKMLSSFILLLKIIQYVIFLIRWCSFFSAQGMLW